MTFSDGRWTPDPPIDGLDALGMVWQTMRAELSIRGDGWERGVRVVRLENDRVSVDVAVDRGLDLPSARIDAIPVGWRSPVPVTGPWFFEPTGFDTQRGFFGGLLTTAGLNHVGLPDVEASDHHGYPARPAREHPLHGRLSGSPATLIGYGIAPSSLGPVAWVEGEVVQVSAFGEHLVLRRRVSLRWGETTIDVDDHVLNRGYAAEPVEILYHVNAGWPVVQPGSIVTVLGVSSPLGEVAPPNTDALEDVRHTAVPQGDRAVARVDGVLADGSFISLAVEWNPTRLPAVVEWRVRKGAGHFAVGLEPTTRLPTAAAPLVLAAGDQAAFGIQIALNHVRPRH